MKTAQTATQVVIIDFGSQYTLIIARRLRELKIHSIVVPHTEAESWLKANTVKAIILSGGHASVNDIGAPSIAPMIVLGTERNQGERIPILGICYGMQLLAKAYGSEVASMEGNREYGQAEITVAKMENGLFNGLSGTKSVWASHGDSVMAAPHGFTVSARSASGGIAAIENPSINAYGIQFHPEVDHTPDGSQILLNFCRLAGVVEDWTPLNQVETIQKSLVCEVNGDKVVMGFSGGVDSTVTARMLGPVLKDNLLAILIDGGNLREGEVETATEHARLAGVTLQIIDARKQFVNAFAGITDAAMQREIFKRIYRDILVETAEAFGANWIIQGTLATDLIESGKTGGAEIKAHHNTGLDFGSLKQLHPLREIFKHEVREIGRNLGLPSAVFQRHPFPGPGLFLRVLGPITDEALDTVRWADARVTEILVKAGIFETLSQLVVAYDATPTVCVKGDARAYVPSVIVRGVITKDFMTANGYHFPEPVWREILSVLTKHRRIGRVYMDATDKPPATTEFK